MPAISFQEEWIDKLLRGDKQQITIPQTDRIKVGNVCNIYNQQRKRVADKPLRLLTEAGLQMFREGYPFVKSSRYIAGHHAHFLGKVEIAEVYEIHPSEMIGENLEAWAWADGFDGLDRMDPFGDVHKTYADEWFSKQYGEWWMNRTWTVIRWNGWAERYFEPE